MIEIKKDILISVIVLTFSLYFISITISIPTTAAFFPLLALSFLGLSSFILFISSLFKYIANKKVSNKEKSSLKQVVPLKTVLVVSVIVSYVFLQQWIGYILATIIAFNFIIFLSGFPTNRKYIGLLISIVVTVLTFLVFRMGLNIPLPTLFFN